MCNGNDDSIYILDDEGCEIGNAFIRTNERNTDINYFHKGGLPMVGENGKMGIVDRNAEWLIDPQFDYITFGMDHYKSLTKSAPLLSFNILTTLITNLLGELNMR